MLEKERHALAVVCSAACLGQLVVGVSIDFFSRTRGKLDSTYSRGDIDRHDPITQLLLLLVWDCVGANHLLQLAVVDLVDRVAAEDTVGHNRDGSSCAVLDNHIGSFAESSAGVCHVVDDDSCATLDITHENHAADFVRTSAFLVDERELDVEAVGDGSRSVAAVSANYP